MKCSGDTGVKQLSGSAAVQGCPESCGESEGMSENVPQQLQERNVHPAEGSESLSHIQVNDVLGISSCAAPGKSIAGDNVCSHCVKHGPCCSWPTPPHTEMEAPHTHCRKSKCADWHC